MISLSIIPKREVTRMTRERKRKRNRNTNLAEHHHHYNHQDHRNTAGPRGAVTVERRDYWREDEGTRDAPGHRQGLGEMEIEMYGGVL